MTDTAQIPLPTDLTDREALEWIYGYADTSVWSRREDTLKKALREVAVVARRSLERPRSFPPEDMGDVIDWLTDRLVNVYGENERTDFVMWLRRLADAERARSPSPSKQEGQPHD